MWEFLVIRLHGVPEKRKRYIEEPIISVPMEHEGGASASDLARRHEVAENTIYRRKSKLGGMEVSEAKRLTISPFVDHSHHRRRLITTFPSLIKIL